MPSSEMRLDRHPHIQQADKAMPEVQELPAVAGKLGA